jgi:preprotein translocase subunit YajC
MLISPAYAQAGGAPGAFDFISLLPLVLIFVVFYFLLIRPQQQKMKRHREVIGQIRKGDRVLTAGGLLGTVVRIEENGDVLLVELAKDVRVRALRSTISDVLGEPQPAAANDGTAKAQAQPARAARAEDVEAAEADGMPSADEIEPETAEAGEAPRPERSDARRRGRRGRRGAETGESAAPQSGRDG